MKINIWSYEKPFLLFVVDDVSREIVQFEEEDILKSISPYSFSLQSPWYDNIDPRLRTMIFMQGAYSILVGGSSMVS